MFGQILTKLREEKDLNKTQLAKALGVSDRLVGYYEAGDRLPPMDMLEKIADYFNVSVDYLLGRSKTVEVNTKDKASKISDEIINILIESGEITKEELKSGTLSDKRREELLSIVKFGLVVKKEVDKVDKQ